MTHIIIHGEERRLKTLKGKSVTEFANNMESIGWPTEFINEEAKDRAKFVERKERRSLQRQDVMKIEREMGLPTAKRHIKNVAESVGAEYWERGQPEPE